MLDPEKSVNKLFENVLCKGRAYSKLFQGGGRAPHFDIFSGRVALGQIEERNYSRGYGVMLPRKLFENLGSVVVVLVLF